MVTDTRAGHDRRQLVLPDREEPNMAAARANADQIVLMSADGFEQRCGELETLRNDARRQLSDRLREARQDGDLADNPALVDLLEEQAQLERRIAVLEAQLAGAEIVTPAADGCAGIGSLVRVRDLSNGDLCEYELVGRLESDVGNGRVSIGAPVGRALFGQRAGARVEVMTPRGPLALQLVKVCPARQPAVAKEAA
jgi:transcription elongation factor GreA